MKKRRNSGGVFVNKAMVFAAVLSGLGITFGTAERKKKQGNTEFDKAMLVRAQEKRQRRLDRNRVWYWHLCRADV